MTARARLRAAYLEPEGQALSRLSALADLNATQRTDIDADAADLVRAVRASSDPGLMEEFLAAFGLSTREGVALMCLAEALLRVPDDETIDDLIQDKIAPHDWGAHLGRASSSLVNASTWALMLTGQVIDETEDQGLLGTLRTVVRKLGEPVVRVAVSRAMREMGAQFVLGRDIDEAVRRGDPEVQRGYTYSYDMLGEGAKTDRDAQRYHGAYAHAIATLAARAKSDDIRENPGISVKLSALHPRYEAGQREGMLPVLTARTLQLAQSAKAARMGFNIDAEEADRLDLSLDVIEAVLSDPSLAGWDGFGVVVQAYGQRAAHAIDWLHDLATQLDRRVMVRLVKGAYWDTEIKRAQVLGLNGFPVFTRKAHTDVSYIANARKLLSMTDRIYPQFATHNAHTVAAVLRMADLLDQPTDHFEFQRLHGMGEALHEMARTRHKTRCRIYAPVGAHRDLLAYLVRRLLENGANSSFVHQIVDETVSPEEIATDPFAQIDEDVDRVAHPAIARPPALFGETRRNAKGWDITDPLQVNSLTDGRAEFANEQWSAGDAARPGRNVLNPANAEDVVGQVHDADPAAIDAAFATALSAQAGWQTTSADQRAAVLAIAADLFETRAPELMALLAREAGKTWIDAVGEIREAVDFLRYYGAEARRRNLPPARGVFVCISPWNFPLAIFTGQIAAALATGNAVLAKPAEQTPLIAARAVSLLHEAGVPAEILHLLPGDGARVGAALTADPRLGGVCFTGSTEVAQIINRQLAQTAPDAALIAETGGLNAMIVDSTALPEQAVRDILASAFQSAGQRCSALRILYIQRDVEERFLEMLFGAMDTLRAGDPWDISTDVGPLIDAEAHANIASYCEEMEGEGRLMHKIDVPESGHFLAPQVFRVRGIERMTREIFGPVLHVAPFDAHEIDSVIADINAKGYGLTFGLHTRVDARVQHVVDQVHAGNIYVNRNQIGAIVGSQPFGGEGLSGTGPKAGGPFYLDAFVQHETSDNRAGTPAGSELGDITAPDATEWAARRDRNSVLRAALRGKASDAMSAAAAIDPGPIDLPGPTGESNRYRLVPRGVVICLGPGNAVLDQAVQALSMGNAVIAIDPEADALLSPLRDDGLPLTAVGRGWDAKALSDLEGDVFAWSGDPNTARSLRQMLAGRDGPIVPLVRAQISPVAYAHERAICIDTTAAGGNTTLFEAAG